MLKLGRYWPWKIVSSHLKRRFQLLRLQPLTWCFVNLYSGEPYFAYKGMFSLEGNNNQTQHFQLYPNATIEWINGAPPVDEPECGFDNEKCIETQGKKLCKFNFFQNVITLHFNILLFFDIRPGEENCKFTLLICDFPLFWTVVLYQMGPKMKTKQNKRKNKILSMFCQFCKCLFFSVNRDASVHSGCIVSSLGHLRVVCIGLYRRSLWNLTPF